MNEPGTILLFILAAAGGVAVAVQGQFMGILDRTLGTREGVFITYAGGGILISLVMMACRGGGFKAWKSVPWWACTSGLIGLVIVGAIGYTVPRLGLSRAFTILVAAQFMVSALLDHFGLLGATVRPIQPTQFLGLAPLIAGVWLMVR